MKVMIKMKLDQEMTAQEVKAIIEETLFVTYISGVEFEVKQTEVEVEVLG